MDTTPEQRNAAMKLAKRIKGQTIVCSGPQPLWLVRHASKFESLTANDIQSLAALAVEQAAAIERLEQANAVLRDIIAGNYPKSAGRYEGTI